MQHWCTELSRLLADLLEYPVEHPRNTRNAARAVLEGLETGENAGEHGDAKNRREAAGALAGLLQVFETASLAALRHEYVEMFDQFAECGLDMACHRYGVSDRQERARAELNELYRENGFIVVGLNCPDYLPLMLEFLAVAPEDARKRILDGYGTALLKLGKRLETRKNVYAHAGACLTALTDALLCAAARPLAETISRSAASCPRAAENRAAPALQGVAV